LIALHISLKERGIIKDTLNKVGTKFPLALRSAKFEGIFLTKSIIKRKYRYLAPISVTHFILDFIKVCRIP